MEKRKIIIKNSLYQPQEFVIEEHEEHIVLLRFLGDGVSKDVTHIDIPTEINGKTVTDIGASCFFNCTKIESVSFPETITTIGEHAFVHCSGIRELIMPDSITDIGESAFQDCRGLKKVILPKNLKRMRHGLFSFCYLHDSEIILPDGLEVIEGGVFWSGGTFELEIPESVKEIGVGAFHWGPSPKTALPYDKGWFSQWPYGESVESDDGSIGKITDLHFLEGDCMLHEVSIGSNVKNFFYPCDYADGLVHFIDEKNNLIADKEIEKLRKADEDAGLSWKNKLSDAYKIRTAWQRGLVVPR